MTAKRDGLREDTHFRVLRLLQDNPEMSQRDLAEAACVSVGGMHYVMRALIEKGWIKLGNFSAAEDKRRYAYILTPQGLAQKATLTRRFLARKMAEYEALTAEIESIREELGGEMGDGAETNRGSARARGREMPRWSLCSAASERHT